jgi:hypothetical protein
LQRRVFRLQYRGHTRFVRRAAFTALFAALTAKVADLTAFTISFITPFEPPLKVAALAPTPLSAI